MPVRWATADVVVTTVLVITHVFTRIHIVTLIHNVPAVEMVKSCNLCMCFLTYTLSMIVQQEYDRFLCLLLSILLLECLFVFIHLSAF